MYVYVAADQSFEEGLDRLASPAEVCQHLKTEQRELCTALSGEAAMAGSKV